MRGKLVTVLAVFGVAVLLYMGYSLWTEQQRGKRYADEQICANHYVFQSDAWQKCVNEGF